MPHADARRTSYGQGRRPSPVDRLGVWLNARALRRAVDLRGRRVADLGCGFRATVSMPHIDDVASLTLVDVAIDPDVAAHPKVTALHGHLPAALAAIPDGALDVVLVINVLEHIADADATLAECRRLLTPGGTLLVNVPSWRGKFFLETAAFRLGVAPAEEMDDHKCYYDPRDLWPRLVRAGFPPRAIRCRRHKLGLNTIAVARVPKETP